MSRKNSLRNRPSRRFAAEQTLASVMKALMESVKQDDTPVAFVRTQLVAIAGMTPPSSGAAAWEEARAFLQPAGDVLLDAMLDLAAVVQSDSGHLLYATEEGVTDVTHPTRAGVYAIAGILRALRNGELIFAADEAVAAEAAAE